MRRRGFLAAALALLAAPVVPAAWAKQPPASVGVDLAAGPDATAIGIFRGEIGRYDGVRFFEGVQWSADDLAAISRRCAQPLVLNLIRPEQLPWA